MKALVPIAIGLMVLAAPLVASAQCQTDSDCDPGLVCVWEPCPAIDCAPGSSCPEPACPEVGSCVDPGGSGDVYWGDECVTDAECPSGFACEATELGCETYGCGCACPGCDPDQGTCPPCECECPEPPPCDNTVIHVCAYSPPTCGSDADCDPGFECAAEEVCYGSGCACADVACTCVECPPGETCPPCECPEPPPCDCPTDPVEQCDVVGSYCVPTPVSCTSPSDCETDWECVEIGYGGTDCACAGCACMSPEFCPPEDQECIDQATNCDCPPCDCPTDPVVSESYCLPPGWSDLVDSQASTSTGTARNEASPTSDFIDHVEETQGGTTTTTGGSGGGDSGGCSVGSTSDGSSHLPLVMLFGLWFVVRRRKA